MSALNLRALFGIGTTATVTTVTVGPTVAEVLLNSNSLRKGFVVYNITGQLYIKLGSNASSLAYTQRLTANTSWEVANYTGEVSAIKATGTTNVLVTSIE